MKNYIFIFSHDDIFQGVKMESSQFSVRKSDKEGNSLFENLVFDEAYLAKFRELFFDAQSKVTPAFSRYILNMPNETGYFESQDVSKNRDYILNIAMPFDFDKHMAKPIDIKLNQFFIAYIMYRWLETKLPEESAIYRDRSDSVIMEAKALLERRIQPIRRNHRLW